MFYHVAAYRQLPVASVPLIVSVPSGNFGNLTAGIFAKRIGLPVAMYIASTNANDVVPEYLRTGVFSSARGAGDLFECHGRGQSPIIFRACSIYGRNRVEYVQKEIWGHGATDEETLTAMKMLHEKFGYISDPHTVGWRARWEAYKSNIPSRRRAWCCYGTPGKNLLRW